MSEISNFIDKNHSYIDYSERPSRKLYWKLFEDRKMIGVFGLGSAFSQPKDVKEFMEKYDIEFNNLANNIVYCLSGHEDYNAGSKLLAKCRRDAIVWWYERYEDKLKAFQCFVKPPRNGAVYKADNWELVGKTKGESQVTKHIRPDQLDEYEEEEIIAKEFSDGRVMHRVLDYKKTEKKLIFMKKVKEKELRKGIKKAKREAQLSLF